ncbi:hypothetical protein ACA910_017675 [Epithemia clementina (nom. ined.)]
MAMKKLRPMKQRNMVMMCSILALSFYCYMIALPSRTRMTSNTFRFSSFRPSTPSDSQHQQNTHKHNQSKSANERECSIYVAPSSLKGNPGYGIFTTRNLWKGEKILGGPDGVAIPVEGYNQRDIPKGDLKEHWIRLWDPYWWGRGVPDHVAYEAGPDIVDFQIGFGYLPNHHCELSSLDPGYPQDAPYEDSLANRFESPGAGAFSYNVGREFSSTRDVKPGEELFMSYGYCRHGQGPRWTKDVHMPAEFNVAADIIWNRIGPKAKESFQFDSSGNVVLEDDVIGEDTRQVKYKLVKELLPETKEQYQKLAAAPLTREDLPKYLARTRGINARTPEWIREHGMCLEALVPRKSTLPHAGQGAFAQFSIKKNDIITMAPLLHIMDKDVLALYNDDDLKRYNANKQTMSNDASSQDAKDEDNANIAKHPSPIGTQLLLNYCFSNPQSTILLCPTTNAVLINHCSKRKQQCGPNGPNADYRWSSGWDPTSDEWRQQSLKELKEKSFRGLSFEIYALRDIAPGEEVFIDYGEAWEEAWEKHMQGWTPPPRIVPNWISAKEANAQKGPILQELTAGLGKIVDTVDHPYLMTGCVYWTKDWDSHAVFRKPNPNWQNNQTYLEVLNTYSDDGSAYKYKDSKGYAGHNDGLHWPCTVLWQQNPRQDTYVVRIHPAPSVDPSSLPWARNGLPRLLKNYPRESIRYFVKPYASDQHLPGAFRQPIGLRDGVLPDQWRNIGSSNLTM